MGSFKWKKVWMPISKTEGKSFKVNRLSNHQLWRFIKERSKLFRTIRKMFSPAYRQAYELAQKKGLI